jgi:hypothetical protein
LGPVPLMDQEGLDVNGQDDLPRVADCFTRLRRSGWSVGETAFSTEGGGLVSIVTGTNGENAIRAEGATAREA